jgi:subtilase family serine protease
MRYTRAKVCGLASLWTVILLLAGMCPAFGAGSKVLPGHVPDVVHTLVPLARLASTNQLRLAIGVSMSNAAGLEQFAAQVSDPNNPGFRQYLSREELTARFGPTAQDYDAVKNFAITNGLTIVATNRNRLVLDVTGPVSAVEKAFHVRFHIYQHPTEGRTFFAPDSEPTVDAALRMADVEGLTDYWRPHPRRLVHKISAQDVPRKAANGTAPDGSGDLFGNDFRNAYVPGTKLTGAGQSVGLLEFDGYFTNDIYNYAKEAGNGRTNIAIVPVLLDGYDGTPSTGVDGGESEVELDIEMAMSIAPGLSQIVSYEAGENGNQNDILNAMLDNSNVVNLSCCWAWFGGPTNTTDDILISMEAVGQTFFDASGDSGAFTTGVNSDNGVDNPNIPNAPSSNPYMVQVGGTTLVLKTAAKTNRLWSSEVVWHYTSGGISSYYTIPWWQTNVSGMKSKGGSTEFRNIPDVAGNANNVYEIYNNGDLGAADDTEGTSCAAPIWAGFMALVNEQSISNGGPIVGFINPALYTLSTGTNYHHCFHDIVSGNDTWSESRTLFSAKPNYDLCSGLGTMGTNLINKLASVPAPHLLALTHNAGRLIVQWASVPQESYQLQYATNLINAKWINLGPPTNASSVVTSMSEASTNSPRFYRVILYR